MLLLQGPRGWLYERLCGLLLGPRVLLLRLDDQADLGAVLTSSGLPKLGTRPWVVDD